MTYSDKRSREKHGRQYSNGLHGRAVTQCRVGKRPGICSDLNVYVRILLCDQIIHLYGTSVMNTSQAQ